MADVKLFYRDKRDIVMSSPERGFYFETYPTRNKAKAQTRFLLRMGWKYLPPEPKAVQQ